MFLGASRYMAMLSAPLFSYLAVSSPFAIYVWLGEGYEGAAVVMTIISLTTLFHLLTGSSSGAARGLNKLGWEIKYSVFCLILGGAMTPLLALQYGLPGAAVGVAVSTVVSSIYFMVMTHKYFNISFAQFCRHVLHPVVAALLSALAISFILSSVLSLSSTGRIPMFFFLLFFGAVHLGCSSLILGVTRGITEAEKQWLMTNVLGRIRPFYQQLFSYTRR